MIRILFITPLLDASVSVIIIINYYSSTVYNTTIIGRLVDRNHVTYVNSKSTR